MFEMLFRSTFIAFQLVSVASFGVPMRSTVSFSTGFDTVAFALIGQMTEPEWIGHEPVRAPVVEEEWEDDDELDFEMF